MDKKRKLRLRRIADRAAARRQEKDADFRIGLLHTAAAGYGFFTPEVKEGEPACEDIFVPVKFLGNALDGDTVKVKILPPRPGHPEDRERGPVGKVVGIIRRDRESFVGELLPGSFVTPLDPKLPETVGIHGPRRGAERGDWVRIKCETGPEGELSGSIAEVIGRAGVISADLDAVMAEFELPGRYSPEEEAEAAAIIPETIAREDRRDLVVLTIDPFDAKDFDDALSVRENPDGTFEVGIHIADVAAFIRPGTKFDRLAKKRAFSCYLPGRTLPMLPAGLTAKISMRQDEDSLAHSVFLTVDADGRVIGGRRVHTLIRVAKRLDYDEVQTFLASGKAPEAWSPETAAQLTRLAGVVRSMRLCRERTEQFIDLPLPEIRVLCDEAKNTVSGIERRLARESEQLVEECMLAANQFVGLEMPRRSTAGIYRVHPAPDPEKTAEFADVMNEAFQLSPGDISDRRSCRKFIASLADHPCRELILGMLLRSLARASYSVKGEEHFALGKTFYAHFTSPIRRYTDLTVHQQLWALDSGQRCRGAGALEPIAEYCSETEEKIDGAFFAANDRLKIRIIEAETEKDPGKVFEGIVVKILTSGLQIELPEYGLLGFAPNAKLKTPQFALNIGSRIRVCLSGTERTSVFFREAPEAK